MTEETSAKEKLRSRDIPCNIEPYFVALLFRGERWNDTQGAEAAGLASRHLAFLRRQTEAGRYLLAGPITDDGPLVGISIISAQNIDEARIIAAADPGVEAGRLKAEVHPAFLPSLQGLKVTYS